MREEAKALAKKIFGNKKEKDKFATTTASLIVGDMITLYAEFKKARGAGALFMNPECPEQSVYLTLKEIHNDVSVAEEFGNNELVDVLKRLINVAQNSGEDDAVIVTVDSNVLSAHVLNMTKSKEQLNNFAERMEDL